MQALAHHPVYRIPRDVVWGFKSVLDIVQDGLGLTPQGPMLPQVIVEHAEELPYRRTWPTGKLGGGQEAVPPKPGLLLLLDH